MSEPQPQSEVDTEADTQGVSTPHLSAAADEAKSNQVAELKDQLLRAVAETENTRRRAQKEREDTAKYAVGNFAKEMLAVADNFIRALEASPKDIADPAIKNLLSGIEATSRQLQAAFERFGIKKLDPLGEPFDPHFHRVMVELEEPNKTAGTVVQVMQAGYVIHDRLLREALVAVAKGGPNPATKVDTKA